MMQTSNDKLYSKEQIEEWASKRADDAGRLSRQLLDTMRENERLLDGIDYILRPYDEKSDLKAHLDDKIWKAKQLLHPHKESDNG